MMRNFYQSNTACSSIEADKSIGHQIIIKHENNNMSCSFSSKTKSKSNLPIPLVVSHQSLLPSQDHIHKRKLKINHLANFNTSLSPTSSLQTKLLNMNNNVCLSLRPNLNNQTDNNYHLLPESSSSSSSLSTSLSIEPMFISEQFQLQQQQLRKENKFIIKKNSSLSSKTSSSSSSAYSSFGSTASSPAPSPNSSNYNNNASFQIKQHNVQQCYISNDSTVNNFVTLFKQEECNISQFKPYKNYSKIMLNEEQNDRFFESNTLYKKELKQKQRDILTSAQQSPTSNTNSTIQYKPSISSSVIESDLKSTTFNTFTKQQQLTSNQSETNILKSNSFSILSPNHNAITNEHKHKKKSQHNSSNKVLNLFSHFLNRNKSSSPSQALTNETNNNKSSENLNTKNSQETNYLNLKYLKRASSSSHFNKSHSNESHQINRKLSTSKLVSQNKISIISNSPLKEQTNYKNNSEEKRPSIVITNEHDVIEFKSNVNRRSYDDATLLNNSDLNNSSFNNKFENTTFSTKNNGLIFIPSPKNCMDSNKQARPVSCSSDINIQIESYNNYENLDQDSESIANHLNEIDSKLPVQINIVNQTKKDDSGAFDNAVYSYVDNIRHHSKRLSDIFAQQLSSTAATNAAAAVINSASSSSSSSSLSLSTKQTDQIEIQSNNLLIERSNSPTTLSSSSSFNNSNKQNENSFENQSYIRVNSMNKVKCGTKFNSGINLNSPASSLTSSSSNYSSNLSISPKSLSSSETIIINKNILNKPVPPLTPNSNVMSLREKFEQFHDSKPNLQTTPNSSMNRLNRNSAHIIQYKEMDTHQQTTIPIVYQSSLTSSLSIKNSTELSLTPQLQQNLVISTSSIQTNSPVSTMSSVSSLSDSSIKDSVSNGTSVPVVANNEFIAALSSSSSSSSSNFDHSERCDEFDFNFFNDLYKMKSEFNKPNQFYSDYEQLCDLFIKNYYSNSFYIQHVLNPVLNESNQQTELLTCFKFTIDYLKQNIFSKFKIKPLDNDLNQYDCLEEANLDIETSDCYKHLANLIPYKDLLTKNDPTNQFDSDKTRLKDFIRKKINYFAKQYNKTLHNIDLNNELGIKLLTQLEQDVNITSFELNKYKLLVNESDVINNLSLKLCNKLANTENSIQIIQLKQMQNINCNLMDSFNQEASSTSNLPELNEEIELLKQELNQIQRKKEETIFLKNGIDKRAATVSDFLQNYLNKEQHQEFELFIQMKSLHAIQLRHIKDHIELSQLQLKLIDDLV